MDELGHRLKRAREERGVSLRDIATRTKISLTALEALERNEFHRLPGGIFSRAVVRAYAAEVGLDPDTTVEDFLTHAAQHERERAERVAAARPGVTRDDREFLNRQRRALRILQVAAVLLAAGAVALLVWQVRRWWPALQRPQEPPVAALAAPPDAAPAPTPAPDLAPVVPADAPSPAVGPAASSPPAQAPAEPPAAAAAPLAPPASAGTAPAAGPVASGSDPPPAAVVAAAAAPLVVELTAAADCQITASRDGGAVEAQVLRAGARQRFEVARELILTVADAGAVSWTINGKPAQPLGRAGADVKVRVTPANAAEFLP